MQLWAPVNQSLQHCRHNPSASTLQVPFGHNECEPVYLAFRAAIQFNSRDQTCTVESKVNGRFILEMSKTEVGTRKTDLYPSSETNMNLGRATKCVAGDWHTKAAQTRMWLAGYGIGGRSDQCPLPGTPISHYSRFCRDSGFNAQVTGRCRKRGLFVTLRSLSIYMGTLVLYASNGISNQQMGKIPRRT